MTENTSFCMVCLALQATCHVKPCRYCYLVPCYVTRMILFELWLNSVRSMSALLRVKICKNAWREPSRETPQIALDWYDRLDVWLQLPSDHAIDPRCRSKPFRWNLNWNDMLETDVMATSLSGYLSLGICDNVHIHILWTVCVYQEINKQYVTKHQMMHRDTCKAWAPMLPKHTIQW